MADQLTARFEMRLTAEEVRGLDRIRGGQSRSAWCRDMLRCAVLASDALEGPTGIRMKAVPASEAPEALNGTQVWVGDD